MKKYYLPVRALHLYIGLLISPIVLIFALSVLTFNHPQFINEIFPSKEQPAFEVKLDSIPVRSTDMLTARAILKKLEITGEVDYINKNDSSMFFPVRTPGKLYRISVNTHSRTASITRTDLGALRGTTYMHYMPGPHNAAIRGNSGFMKAWRYLVDTTVYSLLFLTISGVFLWYFLQSERKSGIYAAAIGVLFLIGLLLFTF
jgi:hypothetical protein